MDNDELSEHDTGTPTAKFRWNSTPYKYFHVVDSHPQDANQVIVNAAANDFFDLNISCFHYNGGSQFEPAVDVASTLRVRDDGPDTSSP